MNTQWTKRVRLIALTAAGIVLVGASVPAFAGQRDNRPVVAVDGWNIKTGPGNGSVKTPGGVIFIGRTLFASPKDRLYFHGSDGKSVQEAPATHMGPGPWSSKSPYSDRYNSK